MRRYNYGQNFSATNLSIFNALTPLGFLEVSPGDTVSGKFTPRTFSDTTLRPVMNRTYYDVAAFYVPYRLLWDGFPDFIANKDGAGAIPKTEGTVDFFFETDVTGLDECNVWNRRAYNLIYNKFYKLAELPDAPIDFNLPLACSQRQSTFHESCYDPGQITDTDVTIDVVGESVSIDALREGFAVDRYRKIREYYGDKYVDYLAAIGVKASWSIVDDPEPIGKSNKDWVFRQTNATVNAVGTETNNVGDPAGYFEGKQICTIRPTFCPEHGLIVMVGVARMDIPNRDGNGLPHLAATSYSQYYNPEFETRKVTAVNGRLFGSANLVNFDTRNFEHLRKPCNQWAQNSNAVVPTDLYTASYSNAGYTPSDYKTLDPTIFNNLFTGNLGGSTDLSHYQVNNEVRMLKKSPVKPPQFITGVS